jgi:4-amino-4-deoxy-L-arabinose transferase-like glycosyltransferase
MPKLGDIVRNHRAAVAVAILYVCLATAYNLANPLFESPDEHLHYGFVRYLLRERRLPVVHLDAPPTEYHQPPLYYVLTALLTSPFPHDDTADLTRPNPFWAYAIDQVGRDNKNQFLHDPEARIALASPILTVHLTRVVSTLFGLGVIVLTWLLAREFAPDRLAVAAMAVVAFIPNFLLTTASITNDSLAILLGAGACLFFVRILAHKAPPPPVTWIGPSVLMGTALITKLNIWPLLPLSALVVALLALRVRSWRMFLTGGAILLAAALVLGGWWVVRNYMLYGDFTGLAANAAAWGVRGPMTAPEYLVELRNLRRTFWANFGYGNVPVPGWVYALADTFMIGGVIGLLVTASRRRWNIDAIRRDQVLVLLVYLLMTFIGLLWSMPRQIAVTGRHFYPVLPVIAVALVGGWSAFVPPDRHGCLATAITVLMLTFALGAWIGVLLPAYRPSPRLSPDEAQQAIAHRLDWQIGDVVTLLGYSLSEDAVAPGDTLVVTLYWQPRRTPGQNYTLFLHLFGRDNVTVGSRNTYPGLGNDPTIYWRTGEIIQDAIPIRVASETKGPILLDIEAGLYDLTTSERLPIRDPTGNEIGYPVIGRVKLKGSDGEHLALTNTLDVKFEGGLVLRGYDLSATSVVPGEHLNVTLYWSPSAALPVDYTVFIHLLDEQNNIVAQGDGPPLDGRYPTTAWAEAEQLADTHVIEIVPGVEAGHYHLIAGLYDAASGTRLLLVGGGDYVTLREDITVRPDKEDNTHDVTP